MEVLSAVMLSIGIFLSGLNDTATMSPPVKSILRVLSPRLMRTATPIMTTVHDIIKDAFAYFRKGKLASPDIRPFESAFLMILFLWTTQAARGLESGSRRVS